MNSVTEPLEAEEFERRLRNAVLAYPFEETRFYQLIAARRCPPSFLLTYGYGMMRSARLFCGVLATLIQTAPDLEAKALLLENLMEEEGLFLRAGVGMVYREETGHERLASRFVEACGGDPKDLAAIGGGESPLAPGVALVEQGRWLEGLAYMLVGQEYKFSSICTLIFDALRAHGFSDRDLAFFAVHGQADQKHGEQAIGLVRDRAVTRAQQDAALQAVEDGARHWFEVHGGSRRRNRAADAA